MILQLLWIIGGAILRILKITGQNYHQEWIKGMGIYLSLHFQRERILALLFG